MTIKSCLLCLFIVLSSVINCRAQKIDFADKTNKWYFLEYGHPPEMGPNWFANHTFGSIDTPAAIINGYVYTYTKMDTTILVRTDTIANKVFYRFLADTADRLLFDYNLQAGDSFIYEAFNMGQAYTYHYFVNEVDSIQINGVWHKTFLLFCNVLGANAYPSYVEGYGCIWFNPAFIIDPVAIWAQHPNTVIDEPICFRNKSTYPLITQNTHFSIYQSCADTTLSITQSRKGKTAISVFPQPATDLVNFKLGRTIKTGNLYVLDMYGGTVYQLPFKEKSELKLNLSGLSGIYIYRIVDNTDGNAQGDKLIYR